jgi:hypothetical protein
MISDSIIIKAKALLNGSLGPRSPVHVDAFIERGVTAGASGSGVIKNDIDVSQFVYGLLYCEATFSAAANGALTIKVNARIPGDGGHSDEAYESLVLAHNTVSPYKRRGWLKLDLRYVDNIETAYSSANSAAATTIDLCSLGLVL